MIIRRVILNNYGVYGGNVEFKLTPQTDRHFNRPVVLFSGKNGAGKTTFVEAIRVCLHGSLALGDRVSRREYEDHLLRRIHRPFREGVAPPDAASIILEFDFVRDGERHTFEVERSWSRTKAGVSEQVSIMEDGKPPAVLRDDQRDSFLRELIPSSAANLFFFDGEKIDKLTDEDDSRILLKKTVEAVLGLHLVDRLDSDLDVFISRRASESDSEMHAELENAQEDVEALKKRKEELEARVRENREAIKSKQAAIDTQRQRIKSEGGDYAEDRAKYEQRKEVLEQKIETQRKHIQSLADGVMPFSVAPTMCRKVQQRLEIERQYQEWRTSEDLIDQQVERLSAELASDAFWKEVGLDPDAEGKEQFGKVLTDRLRKSNPAQPIEPEEVIIHASARERGKLNNWIDEVLGATPDRFREAVQDLINFEQELEDVNEALAKVPQDIILQPLVETLNKLIGELDELQKESDKLADELGSVVFQLDRAENHFERLKERLQEEQRDNERVQLALRAQKAFRAYAARLKRKKLALLEDALSKRFNQLCYKETILDNVEIALDTFEITLHRGGETFKRFELSAGERQLFAIATIWALREVSEVPMPVAIDTPLGRLDDDHRQAMIQRFIPRASHQVFLLATDSEVDMNTFEELEPALSHAYHLRFDDDESRTIVSRLDITASQKDIFEEVVAV